MASSVVGHPEVDEVIHVHPRSYLVRDAAMFAIWLAIAAAFLVQISTPAGANTPAAGTLQGDSYAMAGAQVPCAVDRSK